MFPDRTLREVFHFHFLERLLKTTKPIAFTLKGGVNLRFFFKSPRYSEDMDLDVSGVPVHVLREKGYRLLAEKSFLRVLESHGIRELRLNDPSKAKHTETTQRFRLRLVTGSGEEFPTKVEFSRRERGTDIEIRTDPVDPEIARRYGTVSFLCPHYSGTTAAQQKIQALAGRALPQARDLFDLYLLHLGGHFPMASASRSLTGAQWKQAAEHAADLGFEQFRDQVLDFLEETERREYETPHRWKRIQEEVLHLLLRHD
ncbi:MAG TPA: nucleotidyl transferase AbiEii/AbiGii toxin family protein [Bdellovibrionota bacterium]|nr:nucleotidyl transferase AbiEii/AbiGii toxin family protein [Bdellovibrionota bacterium]